jgi:hypothetical protein
MTLRRTFLSLSEKKICAGESGTSCYNFNNYISFIEPLAKTFDYFSHDYLLKIAIDV